LNAQQTAFEEMKPGTTIKHLNQVVIDFYRKELKKIGLIRYDDEVLKYYYHGVSHHIGLNVHDLSLPDEPLKAGCIISNEPGLYIKEESIGIRLEDDILITPNGAKWLSINVNKDI
jgi:Xaa-Pro aminopeptidase